MLEPLWWQSLDAGAHRLWKQPCLICRARTLIAFSSRSSARVCGPKAVGWSSGQAQVPSRAEASCLSCCQQLTLLCRCLLPALCANTQDMIPCSSGACCLPLGPRLSTHWQILFAKAAAHAQQCLSSLTDTPDAPRLIVVARSGCAGLGCACRARGRSCP